jgi:putative FmdB family regulatory protein
MPIYEFKCSKCDNIFEDILAMDVDNPKCPECQSETEKLVSRVLGIVKGSTNRTIDCKIGDDANRRWADIYKRRDERKKKNKGGV